MNYISREMAIRIVMIHLSKCTNEELKELVKQMYTKEYSVVENESLYINIDDLNLVE